MTDKRVSKLLLVLFAVLAIGTSVFVSCGDSQSEVAKISELHEWEDAEFVGAESCKKCHANAFQSWTGSHHQKAMDYATSTSVLGDFNNASFALNGVTTHFFKRDETFMVRTIGPSGEYEDFEIAYVFGFYPLQQYLVKFPNGAVQCLQIAWDDKAKKWYDLQPDLSIKTDEWIHWTNGGMRWNTMCADCHSTNLAKKFDLETEMYHTSFSEINVSCEACHGPGENHVAFYTEGAQGREVPEFYMTKNMDSEEVVDKCGRCHSRRAQLTDKFDYHGSFTDHYSPSMLEPRLYHSDGQIKDEVYVYGSFLQSKMYHNDVSCIDCHDPHTNQVRQQGNQLCLTCHEPKYNDSKHTMHAMDSKGGQCIECHMPGKFYMGNDFRRDHSFRVPRPDLSLSYGTPNACMNCHESKGNEWAANAIKKHYGNERVNHFSEHMLAGHNGDLDELLLLVQNDTYPDIARASGLNFMAANSAVVDPMLFTPLLKDDSELIRAEAINLFMSFGDSTLARFVAPMLSDDNRMVRIQAAQYFNTLGIQNQAGKEFNQADAEFVRMLKLNADFASGQFMLGVYYEGKGDDDKAEKAYLKSIELDDYFNQSKMNLALFYSKKGQLDKAIELLKRVVAYDTSLALAYYYLGLLYNENGESSRAIQSMEKAISLQSASPDAFYNLSLMYGEQNASKSNQVLNKGIALFPYNEKLLYLKFTRLYNAGDAKACSDILERLIEVNPNNQNYYQLLSQIQS